MLILLWQIAKNTVKVVPKGIQVLKVRFYRILNYYNTFGFLSESMICTVFLFALTRDLMFVAQIVSIMLVIHVIVYSNYVHMYIQRRVY